MNTGALNRLITIKTYSETVSSGDVTGAWSAGETVRAKVTQVDGTRFVREDELIDRAVYRIECFDNSYSDNIQITYGTLTLYPVRPITRNPGRSNMNEIVIIAATKK
jgi:hypothetical protein